MGQAVAKNYIGVVTTDPISVWHNQLDGIVCEAVALAIRRGYKVQAILSWEPGQPIPAPKLTMYTRAIDNQVR